MQPELYSRENQLSLHSLRSVRSWLKCSSADFPVGVQGRLTEAETPTPLLGSHIITQNKANKARVFADVHGEAYCSLPAAKPAAGDRGGPRHRDFPRCPRAHRSLGLAHPASEDSGAPLLLPRVK